MEKRVMKKTITISIVTLAILGLVEGLWADDDPNLSIYDIQYTTDPDGISPHAGEIVDCLGGIVVHKYDGFYEKLTFYDPAHPGGWGGIQVKNWIDMFDSVQVGDWVSFENALVDESRGNTMLKYDIVNNPGFTVVSNGNPIPTPLRVNLDEITSPREVPSGGWYVEDHRAEKYEHMWLRVEKITVTRKDLGKKPDNYVLQSFEYPSDPNWSCWAADYMNVDKIDEYDFYHPYVEIGSRFCAVEGILEQYTNPDIGLDYYQLITTTTDDFIVGQTADFDDDCDVDLLDFGLFAAHWLEDGCKDPNWCGGADLSQNELVDPPDLEKFSENWLSK
jgi:hypothetical protein